VNYTDIMAGMLATVILQLAKTHPTIAWITPEHNKLLQGLMVLISVLVGITQAASTPGGLVGMDWQATIKLVFENALQVWAAGQALYLGFLKAHESALTIPPLPTDIVIKPEAPPAS
jgi:hypothetical protein